MSLLPDTKATPPSCALKVSDKTVEDFLLATQPCLVNFPPEIREKVREALQERVNRGELGEADLANYAQQASVERALQFGAGL
jgi:hypothetical protein